MPETVAPAAPPVFVSDRPRERRIELDWPISYAGRTYAALTIRRVTADQVAAWAEAVRLKDPDANLGNVVDDDGAPVPTAVLDFLDPDDDETVGGAITDFLPRRLRAAFGSMPDTSMTSSPSAPPSSTPGSTGSGALSGPASSPSP